MKRANKILRMTVLVAGALVVLYFLGPRPRTEVDVGGQELPAIGGLEEYLAGAEAAVPDLVAECRKRIEWAGDEGVVTPVSLVYLHGFSDSNRLQGESMARMAGELGANLFLTRFAGHGHESEAGVGAMGRASLQQWADDAMEAVRIGRLIGDKVVVIGFSTGAPLGLWAISQEGAADVLVMVSPNFGLPDAKSELATGPWGSLIVRLLQGEVTEYATPPVSTEHERYATSRYDSEAIVTMMSAVKLGRDSELADVTCPVLAVHSPGDRIISLDHLKVVMDGLGGSVSETVPIRSSTGHPDEHVLLGTVMSSGPATLEVEQSIVSFVREQLGADQ